MQSKPINVGFLTRWGVIIIHKILTHDYAQRWLKHPGSIVFVFPRLCIKSTPFTSLSEAEAMQFVSKNTTVPVPKVYSAFEHKGRVYIVMERIAGQNFHADGFNALKNRKLRF